MGAPVNGSRRGGRDRARGTRRRIVSAAHDLFLRDGYAATTLDAVAARAGVAVQTVYFHFRNKRTVLQHVVDVAAVGDDEPVPLLERPWMVELRQAPDAAGVLTVWCRVAEEIYERVVPIMLVVREASGSEPDMAAQERTNREQTVAAHHVLAEELHRRGALREGVDLPRAAEELYALLGMDLFVLLTRDLGWSVGEWRAWVHRAATATVLAAPSAALSGASAADGRPGRTRSGRSAPPPA
jgi:AcrR family transcriptional regulator